MLMSKNRQRKYWKAVARLCKDLLSDNVELVRENNILRQRVDRLEIQLQEKIKSLPIVVDPYCPPGSIYLVARAQ